MNHVEPHLRTILNFVGITDLRFVYSGNDEFGGDQLERSLEAATRRVVEVASPTAMMKQKSGDNGGTVVKPAPPSMANLNQWIHAIGHPRIRDRGEPRPLSK